MADEPDLCGGLPKVDVASSEASSTVGCLAAVDAIRILSRQQCGRDLVEEFLCAKVVPLLRDQVWFDVRDDAKYAPWGLKFLKMNLKSVGRDLIAMRWTPAEGAGRVLEIVKESEDLVGLLMSSELKGIMDALNSRCRVNRCFDLIGVVYPNYPSVAASGSEGGPKRKRGLTGGREPGTTKRGRGGCGRGSNVE